MNKYIKQILISVFCLALLTGLIAATCEPAKPTSTGATGAPGAVTLVDSIWSSGNLVFRDKDNNAIFTIDGTNRALVVASAAMFNVTKFASITYLNEGTRTSAQQASIITDETGSGLLVFGTSPTLTTPVITTINPSGSAIVTLPTATTTLVGTDTTNTLTNKTLTSPILTTATASGTWTGGAGKWQLPAYTLTGNIDTGGKYISPNNSENYGISIGSDGLTIATGTFGRQLTFDVSGAQGSIGSHSAGGGGMYFSGGNLTQDLTLTGAPNFGFGSNLPGGITASGTYVVVFSNGASAPTGGISSGAAIYATGGKLYAMDSAGTVTQLTP